MFDDVTVRSTNGGVGKNEATVPGSMSATTRTIGKLSGQSAFTGLAPFLLELPVCGQMWLFPEFILQRRQLFFHRHFRLVVAGTLVLLLLTWLLRWLL